MREPRSARQRLDVFPDRLSVGSSLAQHHRHPFTSMSESSPNTGALASSSRQASCLQCRARKVKCVEEGGDDQACRGCRRLNFPCSWATTVPSPGLDVIGRDLASVRVPRKRVSRACTGCRVQKIRCSGANPCQRCHSQNLACEYPIRRGRAANNSSVTGRAVVDRGQNEGDRQSATPPEDPTANHGSEASGQNVTGNGMNSESMQAANHHDLAADYWYDSATSLGLEVLHDTDN